MKENKERKKKRVKWEEKKILNKRQNRHENQKEKWMKKEIKKKRFRIIEKENERVDEGNRKRRIKK